MSAFIVGAEHLAAIVGSAAVYGRRHHDLDDTFDAMAMANILAIENARSVDSRYGEDNDAIEVPASAISRYAASPLSPVALLKALACYDYQSCEHEGWKDSDAKRFCERAKSWAIYSLPGYDAAAWEVRK